MSIEIVIDPRATVTVSAASMELVYGTMVDIDASIVNKEKIQKCLEFLNKVHDRIFEM